MCAEGENPFAPFFPEQAWLSEVFTAIAMFCPPWSPLGTLQVLVPLEQLPPECSSLDTHMFHSLTYAVLCPNSLSEVSFLTTSDTFAFLPLVFSSFLHGTIFAWHCIVCSFTDLFSILLLEGNLHERPLVCPVHLHVPASKMLNSRLFIGIMQWCLA